MESGGQRDMTRSSGLLDSSLIHKQGPGQRSVARAVVVSRMKKVVKSRFVPIACTSIIAANHVAIISHGHGPSFRSDAEPMGLRRERRMGL